MTTFADAREFLYGLRYHGAKYGLERIERFDQALGQPWRQYPIIHVAGTNGKGSTCAMIESVYRRAGYTTGLFTSPHLVHLGERIRINGEPISEAEICAYVEELGAVGQAVAGADRMEHPSFFEFIAEMALVHFARASVDIAIVEVGLGGRLDATNVVDPAVAVITSIGLDHCDILGDTEAKIAAEKAGIIKPNKPVVVGRMSPEAEEVVLARAESLGAPVVRVVDRLGPDVSAYPRTNLEGTYQRLNAACTVLAIEEASPHLTVTSEQVIEGLDSVRWAGRWERIALTDRTLILDASHNADGARVLREHLESLGQPARFIFGSLGEERGRAMLETMAPFATEIVFVKPHQPRALAPGELRTLLPASYQGRVREARLTELVPAVGVLDVGEPGDVIVVTGSIYLLGEVTEALRLGTKQGALLQDAP